jgi:transcriptional regulator with GAF, ATPase, and Fis domain
MTFVPDDAKNKAKRLPDFELCLEELTACLVDFSMSRMEQTIKEGQQLICKFFGFDRSILWLFNEQMPTRTIQTNLYDPSEDPVQKNIIETEKTFPWIFHQIRQGKFIALETPDTLPREAADERKALKQQGIKSIFMAPISTGNSILGCLSFCCLKEKNRWSTSHVRRLQIITQIFSSEIGLKYREEKIQEQLRFESLVADISTRFVNLSADQLDSQIERAQKSICNSLGIDLSSLWQWSEDIPDFFTITHLYSPPPPYGPEFPEGIDAQKALPWVCQRVMAGETMILNTENMPPEAGVDQELRRFFGVKSSVVIPLCSGGKKVIGILSFDALKKENVWSEQVVDRLILVAQIFTNALARKRGELKLRENQERLSMATSAAGVGLWIMDLDSRCFWATPEARRIFQFNQDAQVTYDSFMEKIIAQDRETVDQAVNAGISAGETIDIDYRILSPDAGVRWINSRGKLYYNNAGAPARLMGVSLDTTRRKQMENKLKQQFEEIKTLKQSLEKENIFLQQKIEVQYIHEEIITRNPEMKKILAQVEQVAQTDATVLIEGETGTGKELFARSVHRLSNRKNHPLVTVNCASLPHTLVESELFGREKGAYTGALTKMVGRFEMADGGTLFLDEIGELPMESQAKLLRVLEQGSFERLGAARTIRVDARIIAATNQDLSKQVAVGKFRKDLYFRLNIFPIHLPPLRDRIEDIPPLTWAFIREYEKKMGKRIDTVTRQCMADLQGYHWPGNIRELRNVIERALIVSQGRTLQLQTPRMERDEVDNDLSLEEIERRHILSVLKKTGWRISGKGSAAGILGLKRTTLQSKMKKLGIQRP